MAFETLKIVAISYFNGVFLIILYKKEIQNVLKNTIKRVSKTRFIAYLYHFKKFVNI